MLISMILFLYLSCLESSNFTREAKLYARPQAQRFLPERTSPLVNNIYLLFHRYNITTDDVPREFNASNNNE